MHGARRSDVVVAAVLLFLCAATAAQKTVKPFADIAPTAQCADRVASATIGIVQWNITWDGVGRITDITYPDRGMRHRFVQPRTVVMMGIVPGATALEIIKDITVVFSTAGSNVQVPYLQMYRIELTAWRNYTSCDGAPELGGDSNYEACLTGVRDGRVRYPLTPVNAHDLVRVKEQAGSCRAWIGVGWYFDFTGKMIYDTYRTVFGYMSQQVGGVPLEAGYTNWDPGEPNGRLISAHGVHQYGHLRWNDHTFSMALPVVCEEAGAELVWQYPTASGATVADECPLREFAPPAATPGPVPVFPSTPCAQDAVLREARVGQLWFNYSWTATETVTHWSTKDVPIPDAVIATSETTTSFTAVVRGNFSAAAAWNFLQMFHVAPAATGSITELEGYAQFAWYNMSGSGSVNPIRQLTTQLIDAAQFACSTPVEDGRAWHAATLVTKEELTNLLAVGGGGNMHVGAGRLVRWDKSTNKDFRWIWGPEAQVNSAEGGMIIPRAVWKPTEPSGGPNGCCIGWLWGAGGGIDDAGQNSPARPACEHSPAAELWSMQSTIAGVQRDTCVALPAETVATKTRTLVATRTQTRASRTQTKVLTATATRLRTVTVTASLTVIRPRPTTPPPTAPNTTALPTTTTTTAAPTTPAPTTTPAPRTRTLVVLQPPTASATLPRPTTPAVDQSAVLFSSVVDPEAAKAINTGGTVAAAASSVASPTAVTKASRMQATAKLLTCGQDVTADSPSRLEHPFWFPMGSSAHAEQVGAVVTSLAAAGLATAAHHVHYVLKRSSRADAWKRLRTVTVLVLLVQAFLLPTVMADATSLVYDAHAPALQYMMAACAVASFLIPMPIAYWMLNRGFRGRIVPQDLAKVAALDDVPRGEHVLINDPVRPKESRAYVETFASLVEPCREMRRVSHRVFIPLELQISTALSFVTALRWCDFAGLVAVILCLLFLLYVVVVRPLRSRTEQVFAVLLAVLQCGMVVAAFITPMRPAAAPFVAYCAFALTAGFVVQPIAVLVAEYCLKQRAKVLNGGRAPEETEPPTADEVVAALRQHRLLPRHMLDAPSSDVAAPSEFVDQGDAGGALFVPLQSAGACPPTLPAVAAPAVAAPARRYRRSVGTIERRRARSEVPPPGPNTFAGQPGVGFEAEPLPYFFSHVGAVGAFGVSQDPALAALDDGDATQWDDGWADGDDWGGGSAPADYGNAHDDTGEEQLLLNPLHGLGAAHGAPLAKPRFVNTRLR